MAGATNYFENMILDSLLGDNAGPSLPATVYVALFTTAPDDAGGGSECTGTGYARVAVTNNSTQWPNASNGQKSNGQQIQFPQATVANWGTITHAAIYDVLSGGNMLLWAALSNSTTPAVNDAPFFTAGTIILTAD